MSAGLHKLGGWSRRGSFWGGWYSPSEIATYGRSWYLRPALSLGEITFLPDRTPTRIYAQTTGAHHPPDRHPLGPTSPSIEGTPT